MTRCPPICDVAPIITPRNLVLAERPRVDQPLHVATADIDLSQSFDLDAGKLTHYCLGCGSRYAELAPEALRVQQFREAFGHATPCRSRLARNSSARTLDSRMSECRHHNLCASCSSSLVARCARTPEASHHHAEKRAGRRLTVAPLGVRVRRPIRARASGCSARGLCRSRTNRGRHGRDCGGANGGGSSSPRWGPSRFLAATPRGERFAARARGCRFTWRVRSGRNAIAVFALS